LKADPADLLVDLVVDFAGELVDGEELQVDGASMAVVVADVGHGRSNGCLDAKFLTQFARQRLFGLSPASIFPPGNSHNEAMG